MINQKLLKISVITPSFNQGNFIEETILSVIGQNYPNLEYIIIDGGSSDNSVEIIKKYETNVNYWISEKDDGQAHAINKGFEIASGDILCWLNSDDLFMPGTLHKINNYFNYLSDNTIVLGNCIHFGIMNSALFSSGSQVKNRSDYTDLNLYDFVIQPSSFWTKSIWKKVGDLNNLYHFAFDWEWFLRAKNIGIQFEAVEDCFSLYRIHDNHKTGTGGKKRQAEIAKIYKIYNSERIYNLYKALCDFDIYNNTINFRIRKKFISTFIKPKSKAKLYKLLKPRVFKKYSDNEITNLMEMM